MSSDASPLSLDTRVRTDLRAVGAVRRWIEAFLVSAGWNEDDTSDAGLLVTELLQNAVEHGSRADGREEIRISGRLPSAAVIELAVLDPGTGKGVASLLARDVTASPPRDAARGRGLFLVHRMCEVFERAEAAGGRAKVRIRFHASGPVPSGEGPSEGVPT